MLVVLQPWTVRARNLSEHADNLIHTDAGARAAGFPAALVAGVTTYAYLTHPVVAAWGSTGSPTAVVRFVSTLRSSSTTVAGVRVVDDDAVVVGHAAATTPSRRRRYVGSPAAVRLAVRDGLG